MIVDPKLLIDALEEQLPSTPPEIIGQIAERLINYLENTSDTKSSTLTLPKNLVNTISTLSSKEPLDFGDITLIVDSKKYSPDTDIISLQMNVYTGGGDYAEGNIDKRQGVFLTLTVAAEPADEYVLHIPHRHNEHHFFGRREELERLIEELCADSPGDKIFALTGMGGVGKTRLAIAFAHKARNMFPGGIFWVRASEEASVPHQIADFVTSRSLSIRNLENFSLEERVQSVMSAWRQTARRLIIFDNVENFEQLEQWFPRGGGSSTLITTRLGTISLESGVEMLRLQPLDIDSSIQLLASYRSNILQESLRGGLSDSLFYPFAKKLSLELGNLPLALELAAHHLGEYPSISVEKYYQDILDTKIAHPSLNTNGTPYKIENEDGIFRVITRSYQQILVNDPFYYRALLMFHTAAALAPTTIPLSVLFRSVGFDPLDVDQQRQGEDVLRLLLKHSLITRETPLDVTLHQLLAEFAQTVHPEIFQEQEMMAAAVLCFETQNSLGKNNGLSKSTLIDHLAYIWPKISQRNNEIEFGVVVMLHELLKERDNLDLLLAITNRAIQLADILHGSASEVYLNHQDEQAQVLTRMGKYHEALNILETLIATREKINGHNNTKTIISLCDLANVLRLSKQYRESQEAGWAAASRVQDIRDTDEERFADALLLVADILEDRTETISLLQQCVSIYEKNYGLYHTTTIRARSKLARCLMICLRDEEAIYQYMMILKIPQKLFTTPNPYRVSMLLARGDAHQALLEYQEALSYYKAALEIEYAIDSEDKSFMAYIKVQIAKSLIKLKQRNLALAHCNEALQLLEDFHGSSHPKIISEHQYIGNLFVDSKETRSYALSLLQKALLQAEILFGSDHIRVSDIWIDLARAYYRDWNLRPALNAAQSAYHIRQRFLGKNHIETLHTLALQGAIFERYGKIRKAKLIYHQTYIDAKEFSMENNLADRILCDLGRVESAYGSVVKSWKAFFLALKIKRRRLREVYGREMRSDGVLGWLFIAQKSSLLTTYTGLLGATIKIVFLVVSGTWFGLLLHYPPQPLALILGATLGLIGLWLRPFHSFVFGLFFGNLIALRTSSMTGVSAGLFFGFMTLFVNITLHLLLRIMPFYGAINSLITQKRNNKT